MRRLNITLLTVLSVAVIGIGADGVGTRVTAAASQETQAAKPPLKPGEQREVQDQRIRYEGAEADAKPGLSKRAAMEAYKQSHEGKTVADQQVELVRYSDDVYGDIQPDGSVTLKFQRHLAYTVRTPDSFVPYYGSMDLPRPVDYPDTCDFIELLDADTGSSMGAFFECP